MMMVLNCAEKMLNREETNLNKPTSTNTTLRHTA